ncbi:hypothetical protein BSL78_07180 [Apostichopus japonicus]|uniref:ADP-ribosylhydrolase ARH1 n=1 Tax=Stichopus japonicus TaxID=307972 RepID=A0A2G8L701_STIJA|nr:hypothetical protein BSL78_07180 [Apostichopus japonicus]
MQDKYIAAMLLSGVGDALGFYGGTWEFDYSGVNIHVQLKSKFNGVKNIKVALPKWPVSDDTVLHLATAEALMSGKACSEDLFLEIVNHYVRGASDMNGRSSGFTTMSNIQSLASSKGYVVPFNKRGGGCGAAMRSMCIGLRYPTPQQLPDLIAVAVESGRMTHNCPTGYLGSVASAYFTSLAIQGKPVESWGFELMQLLPKVKEYIKSVNRDVKQNEENWDYFSTQWMKYLEIRNITDGKSPPKFPEKYGIEERDKFYNSVSFGGWGGASGHDAPMIAYDALLAAGSSWEKFCDHGVFHGGDNDSTGAIGCSWWGALYGLEGVPKCNYEKLEYRERLENAGKKLFELCQ